MAFQQNSPRIKAKPTRKHAFNLMLNTQCSKDYLMEEPISQISYKSIGISPWEECEQPLNRLFTAYKQQTIKSARPKSVNNKSAGISARLYKPWKIMPNISKEIDQQNQVFAHSTIDLVHRIRPAIISLMPEHFRYVRNEVKTPNRYTKTLKCLRNEKDSKANKQMSKTSLKLNSFAHHECNKICDSNKCKRFNMKFIENYGSPTAKMDITDIIRGNDVCSRLIREKIRMVQKRVKLLGTHK